MLGGRDPYEPPFNAPFVNQGANDMNDIDSIVEEKLEDKMENILNRWNLRYPICMDELKLIQIFFTQKA